VALLIEAATDNRNRTSADVRSTMNKNGATPGEPGSVAWMFEQKGLILIDLEATNLDVDDVTLQAIDAGAEDVEASDGTLEVYTDWTELNAVRQALMEQDVSISEADVTMRPTTMVELDDTETAKVVRLLEKLEDLDDVQRVYTNLNITMQNEI
jgi:YebC/PmpR family DNA-binding regulatory protein